MSLGRVDTGRRGRETPGRAGLRALRTDEASGTSARAAPRTSGAWPKCACAPACATTPAAVGMPGATGEGGRGRHRGRAQRDQERRAWRDSFSQRFLRERKADSPRASMVPSSQSTTGSRHSKKCTAATLAGASTARRRQRPALSVWGAHQRAAGRASRACCRRGGLSTPVDRGVRHRCTTRS